MASPPYRFPALCEDEPTRRSARQSCETCGASAVANCVALCCCPCAVVSCFTLALVKAPYVAGRRWVRRAKTRRISRGALRKTRRVRDLDDQLDQVEGLGGSGGTARASKEDWGELGRAVASGWWENTTDVNLLGDGSRMRVSVTEKAWMEMYDVGHWGFGRLSFSLARDAGTTAQAVVRDDPEEPQEDGTVVRLGDRAFSDDGCSILCCWSHQNTPSACSFCAPQLEQK